VLRSASLRRIARRRNRCDPPPPRRGCKRRAEWRACSRAFLTLRRCLSGCPPVRARRTPTRVRRYELCGGIARVCRGASSCRVRGNARVCRGAFSCRSGERARGQARRVAMPSPVVGETANAQLPRSRFHVLRLLCRRARARSVRGHGRTGSCPPGVMRSGVPSSRDAGRFATRPRTGVSRAQTRGHRPCHGTHGPPATRSCGGNRASPRRERPPRPPCARFRAARLTAAPTFHVLRSRRAVVSPCPPR
jgi:hypothetical protein